MKYSILTLALALGSLSATAATSATLILKGKVPVVQSISVASENIATNLPLTTTQTATRVAKVTESSNASSGYKIAIESVNKGKLVRVGGNQQFPYTLGYNGQTVNLSTTSSVSYPTVTGSNVRDVTISYTGVPSEQMTSGDYTDTVTFAISAN